MDEKDNLAEVKVYRFDPSVDTRSRYSVYRVPYKGYTVLNVLSYIYEHEDASLAFRSGCLGKGSACCGACVLLVNGKPALGCQKAAIKAMTIEPHHKFKVIKDLVCDFGKLREAGDPAGG